VFRRLRDRIILAFCLLMLSGGALTTALVSRNMSRALGISVDRGGASTAQVLSAQLAEHLAYHDILTVRQLLTSARESNPDLLYAFVTDVGGHVVAHSFALDGFPSDLLEVAGSSEPLLLSAERGTIRHLSAPVAQGVLGRLHVGVSWSWVEVATREAVGNVLATTVVAMAVGILGILFLAHFITRPVLALRDAARQLGQGETTVEAPITGPEEVEDLAQTFNWMSSQIRDRMAESEALRGYVERVLDQMDAAILVVSEDRQVEYANRAARGDYEIDRGGPCHGIMNEDRPCSECPVQRVLDSGDMIEQRFQAPSGRTYDLKWAPILGREGKPAVVETAVDITKDLELQDRFQRAQRLAVAGELAAGVVHSVNNPLDGIRRALDLASRHSEDPSRRDRMLALAREGTYRIGTITRTLLSFARGGEPSNVTEVEIAVLLDAATGLCGLRADAKAVTLAEEIEEDLPTVWVDPHGMEDVLVNLMMNAVDACGAGGTVRVRARLEKQTIRISVEDSGPGIPLGEAEAVFEPFFTTKAAAQGTGLGLPVARRIVEAHGGKLSLEEGSLAGACFVVRIPLTEHSREMEAAVG
jgi:signal transduction histidine kinase